MSPAKDDLLDDLIVETLAMVAHFQSFAAARFVWLVPITGEKRRWLRARGGDAESRRGAGGCRRPVIQRHRLSYAFR
jgi:hypothetical protein